MQLTQFTDYALRMLVYTANLPDGQRATVSDVAIFFDISRNHLVKVAAHLTEHGFLVSVRGRHGGIELARSAESITIGEVVRVTEPDMDLVECFDPQKNHCRITRNCALKSALHQARNAFLQILDGYTLKDALRSPEQVVHFYASRPGD